MSLAHSSSSKTTARAIIPWLAGLVLIAGCGEKKRVAVPQAGAPAELGLWQTQAWPMARGGKELQGRVHDRVPQQPVVEWTFTAKGAVTSEAAVANGVLVFGTDEGMVIAVDLQTRQQRWRVATKDTVEATPAIAGDRVFAGSNDGLFRALDLTTGTELWHLKGEEKFPTGATLANSPDGAGAWLLVNGYDGVSHCLRTQDGAEVWKHEAEDFINGSPAILDGGLVAFGGCDSVIHVIRLKDGSSLAKLRTEAQIIRSLASWNGTLYGVNYANQLLAAEANGDKLTWLYENDGAQFLTSPGVDEARVYVGSRDKHLHAVDRLSGKLLWKFKTGGRVESAPLVFDDAVVFGSSDGRLYAVDKLDGRELWRLDLGEDLAVAPAFAAGRLVIGGGEGSLFVIKEGAAGK
ncbi:MAG: PQQ-binding-like beta-propeller repeat protein [Verrucomicrobia bacterium]|nr:PQQ-binding-like beta-propeller repeat protein [Verrucomicrobiota bacterium]